ncbi:MAG: hypothetical protein ACLR4X_04975 [Clostridia bacterium]
MKVKFIVDESAKKIEQKVNDWLEDNIKEVLDIKPMKLNDKLIGVLIVYDDFVESETTYQLLN